MPPSEAELDAGIVFGVGALNNNEIRPRLDIDVMIAKQPDVFNLFLLAFMDLKADSSKLGYYQLAGIHGLPTGLWDGVGKDFPDDFSGYCAHGRLIFPTWHRPYLALLEQSLYRKMLAIAKWYDKPHQSKYLAAARAFRLPYWDYFRPRDVDARFPGIKLEGNRTRFEYDFRMPDILNVREVMVRVPPYDSLEPRGNPLYTFRFTDKLNLDKDWVKAKLTNFNSDRTVRRPKDKGSKYHNVQELSDVLNSGREGRASMMLDILNPNSTRYPQLADVASDRVLREGDMTQTSLSGRTSSILSRGGREKAASYGSIEGLHGNYHTIIGGANGHMSHPSIAAFDPVFWLHHCNIDRLFAIWQVLHPNAWFPLPNRDARGRRPVSESEKDLLPFYKFQCELGRLYYDSDWARDTVKFGYTYPDLDRVGDRSAIWRGVYYRYIWSIRSASSSKFSAPPSDMMPLNLNRAQVLQYTDTNARPSVKEPIYPESRIVYQRTASSGSNTITITTEHRAPQDHGFVPTPDDDIDPYFDREWYIDNIVKRNALNGPFTIYFFLCPRSHFSDTNPADYALSPYLAGINHIFASPREVCDNCGAQDVTGSLASETVPISPLLLDYMDKGALQSMRAEHVRPFLVEYLRWRVVHAGDSRMDPRQVPDFEVSISAKISREDGSTSFESYPEIVEDIIYNAW